MKTFPRLNTLSAYFGNFLILSVKDWGQNAETWHKDAAY